MYSIKAINANAEEFYVYRDDLPDQTLKLVNPKLDLTENSAGQLSFKMTPNNAGYDKIDQITTIFTVYLLGEEIWSGRIISVKEDFQKNKSITCEGELAYLNDTTQPQELYSNKDYGQLLTILLAEHNSKVDETKKIYLGEYTPYNIQNEAYDEVYTNYDTTWNAMVDKILNNYYGYLNFYRYAGRNYIDLVPINRRPISQQVIRFGTNLLDFTKNFDSTQFCTVVRPLGKRLEDKYGLNMSGIEGVQAYTTVEDAEVNEYHRADDPYIYRQKMVDAYGWIEEVVHFDDEDDPDFLMNKAKEYLDTVQYDMMTLEVSALDLTYLNVDYARLKLHDSVRVVSKIHGLDKNFPITKMSIPLDNPANTTYTMGLTSTSTMTNRTIKTLGDLTDDLRDTPSIDAVLYQARRDAHDLIGGFTTGYITITQMDNGSNELYVTNQPIPENYNASNPTGDTNVTKYWRWNLNGLEFVNKTVDPDAPLLALDMQGRINASMVNTGKLNAGVIQAGILKNVDWSGSGLYPVSLTFSSSSATEGSWDYVMIYVYDEDNKNYRCTSRLCSGSSNLAGKTIRIPNDEFYIYWYTDGSNDNYYGWSVTSVTTYSGMTQSTKWNDFPSTASSLPTYDNLIPCSTTNQMQSNHNPYGNSVRDIYKCTMGLYPSKNSKNVFYLDLENGVLKMNATSLSISGGPVASEKVAGELASGAASNAENNSNIFAAAQAASALNSAKGYTDNALSGVSTTIDNKIAYFDEYTLTQIGILDKLTGGGVNQGLYISGGKLYINAEYINMGTMSAERIYGGTLKLGGPAYKNGGSLSVWDSGDYYNENGRLIYTLDRYGLTAYTFDVNGTRYAAQYGFSPTGKYQGGNSICYYMSSTSYPSAEIGIAVLNRSNVMRKRFIINTDIYESGIPIEIEASGNIDMSTNGGSITISSDANMTISGNAWEFYFGGGTTQGSLYVNYTRSDGGSIGGYGYTGSKNGVSYICGICVG